MTDDKFEDVLNFLSAAGGSSLYWQLPDPARALAAAAAGAVILDEENDLLIHPDCDPKEGGLR
jgi:hypothetical protein